MKRIAIALAAILLAGCGQQAMLNYFSSPQDQAEAQQVIAQLRQGNLEAVESELDAGIKDASIRSKLITMAALIPEGEPLSVKVVGETKNTVNSATTVNTTFEYQYPEKWLLINVAFRKGGGTRTIVGFRVKPIARSLEEENKFTLSGKNPLQYGVLALAVPAVLLTLYALVACIRTRMQRRKWLWILFILFGVGKFWVNWTTGQAGFMPVAIQLFSASAFANFYGPWTVAVSFPLGAVWFLLVRSSLKVAPEIRLQPAPVEAVKPASPTESNDQAEPK